MIFFRKYFAVGFVLFISCAKLPQNNTKQFSDLDSEKIIPFVDRLEWTGNKLEDANYSIWGSSPIIGDDGKVHVFAARWPEYDIDPAWRKSSEVAHYVAETAESKFVFKDVAIKGSGKDGAWDKYGPHNPEIKKIGEYYVIVYIANSDFNQPPHPANQKIGLAYSKTLDGPWQKAGKDGLILEPSSDPAHWTYGSLLGVDNPCLNIVNGKPVVYFKNRYKDNGQLKSKYGYAEADDIFGKFKMSATPITSNDSYIEDATTFTWNNKYYLLTTDNFGSVTGVPGGGILWKSDDWKRFEIKDVELGYKNIPYYFKNYDSTLVHKIYGSKAKFERPKILMVNNKPAYLFAPSGWNVEGGKRSVCYILKIK